MFGDREVETVNSWQKQDWIWQGHKIQYTTWGSGSPLVLIHGFGASIGHWRHNIPVLADGGYQVFALDLLGFGGSDKPVLEYSDFATNQYLKEVATGQPKTLAAGTLWQMRLNPQTGKVIKMELAVNRGCEFPVVSPLEVGTASRYTYVSTAGLGVDFTTELFGAIARFDWETGTLTLADLGSGRYPSEPIYAPDAINPDRGWILTVVYDSQTDSSEVWVYPSDRLDAEPVCRLKLPNVIPFGFHGTWKSSC